jgi:hypothetical protein
MANAKRSNQLLRRLYSICDELGQECDARFCAQAGREFVINFPAHGPRAAAAAAHCS